MALDFNESNQYVDVGNQSSLQLGSAATFSAWIIPGNVIFWKQIYGQWVDPYVCAFFLSGSKFNFWVRNTAGSQMVSINGGSPVIGETYHFVATYDTSNNESYLYVDGSEIVSGDAGANPMQGTNTFRIGQKQDTSGEFDGEIWDMRYYNRALSPAEIQAIYRLQGSDNIVNGLKGRWLMNEKHSGATATVASSVKDVSGNGNDGTPVNSPLYTQAPLRLYKPQILTG